MNSSVAITFIGIIVAVLIMAWVVFEMSQRGRMRTRGKGESAEAPDSWVPLKPHPADLLEDPLLDADDPKIVDQQTRARQNGHYSHQKKNI